MEIFATKCSGDLFAKRVFQSVTALDEPLSEIRSNFGRTLEELWKNFGRTLEVIPTSPHWIGLRQEAAQHCMAEVYYAAKKGSDQQSLKPHGLRFPQLNST